jgi:hypothetical protein
MATKYQKATKIPNGYKNTKWPQKYQMATKYQKATKLPNGYKIYPNGYKIYQNFPFQGLSEYPHFCMQIWQP